MLFSLYFSYALLGKSVTIIYSPSLGFFYAFSYGVFWWTEVFKVLEPNLSFFLWLVFSEKSLPNPKSQKIRYIFFSKLIVLYLHVILYYIWIIDLCLLRSMGRGSFSSRYSYPAVPGSLGKRLPFHHGD